MARVLESCDKTPAHTKLGPSPELADGLGCLQSCSTDDRFAGVSALGAELENLPSVGQGREGILKPCVIH